MNLTESWLRANYAGDLDAILAPERGQDVSEAEAIVGTKQAGRGGRRRLVLNAGGSPGTHTLTIPDWHPTPLNRLLNAHWATADRLKAADREMIALYARLADIPAAQSKRRVSLLIVLAPRQRRCDADAYWKSLLDGCVHCGLLIDDRDHAVELAPVEFDRADKKATRITLEDIEPEN